MWESLYIFPASFGVGLLNSSNFVAVSAAVERPQLATTISIFFLSQQLGMMIGASGSGALLQRAFRNALTKSLGDSAERREVSIFQLHSDFPERMLTLLLFMGKCLLMGSFSISARSLKEYSMRQDTRSIYPRLCKKWHCRGTFMRSPVYRVKMPVLNIVLRLQTDTLLH